jgi:hypothetical protein
VRSRAGDRRAHARFEIVGTLLGLLETWRPFWVRELGLYGALLETVEPLTPTASLQGRLTVGSRHQPMQAHVRHCRAVSARDKPTRYLVGIAFPERIVGPVGEWILEQPNSRAQPMGVASERRRARRIKCSREAELWVHELVQLELVDISLGGMMALSKTALEPGITGQLRLSKPRLAVDVEVRRLEPQTEPGGIKFRIASSFVSLDERNRSSIAAFLRGAQN